MTYNAVLNAFAKGGIGDAKGAEAILDEMVKLHKEGNSCVNPDSVSYNIVINAWAKSQEMNSGEKAEFLLKRMYALYQIGDRFVKPDQRTFAFVIIAWAQSGDKGSERRAEQILLWMEKLYVK